MFALSCVLASLFALPDRPIVIPADKTWVGKTVYPIKSPMYLDLAAEPNENFKSGGGPTLNMISFRVFAERREFVQVKTREGQIGWLRKTDLVTQDDAVAFFTKQIEANPKDTNGYNRRAAAWRAKGEQDAALKDATEALRINPRSAPLYNNRALIFQAKKEYAKALEDYTQAFQLNPQYPLCLVNRATLWQAKKEYDKAIADCTQAIQTQPQFPNAYRQRAVAYHGKKEFDKAIADFDSALKFDPKSAQFHLERGNSFAAKNEHAKARADHEESLRLEPSSVATLATLALWLASCPEAKFRDGKRALELAQKAHKLERNNSLAIQALAAAYAETGQFAEAVRWQEHALNDNALKNDKVARNRLELYRKMQPYRRGGDAP
jgi:tetratricopeptide (TPR) repeat protein